MISLVHPGQTDSFESFYAQYAQQVHRCLYRKIGNVQDAEDLTADIFEYCYRQFNTFDPQKASIKTWLYVIVNSRYKNYLRSRRCFEDIDDYMEFTASDERAYGTGRRNGMRTGTAGQSAGTASRKAA